MKRRLTALLLMLCSAMMFCGCEEVVDILLETSSVQETELPETEEETVPPTEAETEAPTEEETEPPTDAPAETEASTEPETEEAITEPELLDVDGTYTTPEDVAEYIYTYGELPCNFITKNEAKALGWVSSEGNLWDVAPGMSIGGDYFGNYEGILPDGDYHECDVNYEGGYRGSERLIYGDDGSIYYTSDHYESFTQLY